MMMHPRTLATARRLTRHIQPPHRRPWSSSSPPSTLPAGPSSSLRVNVPRLISTIREVALIRWATPSHTSYPTPVGTSLTPPSTALRSFLARSLGLPKKIDELGNVFLTLPSQRPGNPAIALGGALDTPSPLPVLAALEVVRTLQEGSVLPVAPITLIGWSCTSGSRFPRALLGSGAWAGEVGVEEAWGLRETGEGEGRRTVKACLREGGWLGDAECSVQEGAELGVYFSAATGRGGRVGVGTGTAAWRWLELAVAGGDALAAAARMVVVAREVGRRNGGTVGVGQFGARNAGFSGVVRSAAFALHLRHPLAEGVAAIQTECLEEFERLAKAEGGKLSEVRTVMDEAEITFDAEAVGVVKEVVEDVVGKEAQEALCEWPTDAANTAKRGVPTGVVLVSEDGGEEDWALGAQVLLESVLEWDRVKSTAGEQVTQHGFLTM